ncbi:unnamed protein product [marine sediment metagenome]|uniref:Uncharacterized protein n=1 Tax=marine sediment metagenome TaxID=412755 RepID=X1M987_9ZZZZ
MVVVEIKVTGIKNCRCEEEIRKKLRAEIKSAIESSYLVKKINRISRNALRRGFHVVARHSECIAEKINRINQKCT